MRTPLETLYAAIVESETVLAASKAVVASLVGPKAPERRQDMIQAAKVIVTDPRYGAAEWATTVTVANLVLQHLEPVVVPPQLKAPQAPQLKAPQSPFMVKMDNLDEFDRFLAAKNARAALPVRRMQWTNYAAESAALEREEEERIQALEAERAALLAEQAQLKAAENARIRLLAIQKHVRFYNVLFQEWIEKYTKWGIKTGSCTITVYKTERQLFWNREQRMFMDELGAPCVKPVPTK